VPLEEPNSHNPVLYLITPISINPNTIGTFQVVMSLIFQENLLKTVHGQPRVRVKVKVKVKCTLVQALRLCTGHTAQRGSRGTSIALLFHDHGTRRG
jgi:hypothetical protein